MSLLWVSTQTAEKAFWTPLTLMISWCFISVLCWALCPFPPHCPPNNKLILMEVEFSPFPPHVAPVHAKRRLTLVRFLLLMKDFILWKPQRRPLHGCYCAAFPHCYISVIPVAALLHNISGEITFNHIRPLCVTWMTWKTSGHCSKWSSVWMCQINKWGGSRSPGLWFLCSRCCVE